MRIFIFLGLLALSGLAACNPYSRLLSGERAMLSRVSQSRSTQPAQKLDSLFGSGIRVMEAALKPINPKKGGKIIASFFNQNEAAMEAIVRDIGGGFDKMNLLEQGSFVVNTLRSPNARQFAMLYPKFKKKYNQIQAASKFIGFFGRSMGKFGRLTELLGG
jgi:hypothetical protein